jgi:hypothetical protein
MKDQSPPGWGTHVLGIIATALAGSQTPGCCFLGYGGQGPCSWHLCLQVLDVHCGARIHWAPWQA